MGKEKLESVLQNKFATSRTHVRDTIYKNDYAFDLEEDMVSKPEETAIGRKGGQVIFGDYGSHFYGRLAETKKITSAEDDEFWLEDE